MQSNALLIFVKNSLIEQSSVEDEQFSNHTHTITENLAVDKWIFYADFIDENDLWSNELYQKSLQLPMVGLGEKIANAFWDMIQEGYEKVVIIGNDSLKLTEEIIQNAYTQLIDNEVIIGPTPAGDQYAIGFDFSKIEDRLAEIMQKVFLDQTWSHQVYPQLIEVFQKLSLSFAVLPTID